MSNSDSDNDSFHMPFWKIKCIGRGGFGEAWTIRSKSKSSKEIFLMKTISYDDTGVDLEVEILKSCNHENIVRFIDHFDGERKLHIVMEFCSGGDLAQALKQQRKTGEQFSEDVVLKWCWQLANGLHYMRTTGILHRDLKPANIFLTESRLLKIGDLACPAGWTQSRAPQTP